jgi:hypothetical protein
LIFDSFLLLLLLLVICYLLFVIVIILLYLFFAEKKKLANHLIDQITIIKTKPKTKKKNTFNTKIEFSKQIYLNFFFLFGDFFYFYFLKVIISFQFVVCKNRHVLKSYLLERIRLNRNLLKLKKKKKILLKRKLNFQKKYI